MLKARGDGYWFQMMLVTTQTSGEVPMNIWAIRHDGLIFSSAYFGEQGAKSPYALGGTEQGRQGRYGSLTV